MSDRVQADGTATEAKAATATAAQRDLVSAQLRALRLVRGVGDDALAAPPLGAHAFSRDEFPHYDTLLMVDSPATCVQRVQHSGLCYMHAPSHALQARGCCSMPASTHGAAESASAATPAVAMPAVVAAAAAAVLQHPAGEPAYRCGFVRRRACGAAHFGG